MTKIIVLTILVFVDLSFSQIEKNTFNTSNLTNAEIIGVWQENDSLLASGLDNVYRFYNDSTFSFDVGYGYLTRLLSLRGKYLINKNTLNLTVTETIESEGGEISFGDNNSDELRWMYVNDHGKRLRQQKPKTFSIPLSFKLSEIKEISYIKIAYQKYYKISKDPHAYMNAVDY